tara:strand:+ start:374 stop:667 length:294 start_codon:yes stop_codon:yes gene_type:complete
MNINNIMVYNINDTFIVNDGITDYPRKYIIIRKQFLNKIELDNAINFKYSNNSRDIIEKDPYYYYLSRIDNNNDSGFLKEMCCLVDHVNTFQKVQSV